MTNAVAIAQQGSNNTTFRNRIINGAMMIDQRNAGASITPTSGQFSVDRYICYLSQASKYTVQQNAGSVTPPTGFANYLGFTSSSAYSVGASDYFFFAQFIEGFNTADLAWGTANAKTVTLSFQVYSSLTGTFGGSIRNDGATRSYPFTYTISSANTWTTVSITIAGDTTGTWLTNNGVGIRVQFGLGVGSTYSGTAGAWASANYFSATGAVSVVGTSGATFYVTGVQLEAGSAASPFENRSYGVELQLCQRYFQTSYLSGTAVGATGTTNCFQVVAQATCPYLGVSFAWPVAFRAAPTITLYSTQTGATGKVYCVDGSFDAAANTTQSTSTVNIYVNNVSVTQNYTVRGQYAATAEL
jgi:hypothetical protein